MRPGFGPVYQPRRSPLHAAGAGGWAYGAIYRSSHQRTAALTGWLHFYNHQRKHGSLSHQPPISRLNQLNGNNLTGTYS